MAVDNEDAINSCQECSRPRCQLLQLFHLIRPQLPPQDNWRWLRSIISKLLAGGKLFSLLFSCSPPCAAGRLLQRCAPGGHPASQTVNSESDQQELGRSGAGVPLCFWADTFVQPTIDYYGQMYAGAAWERNYRMYRDPVLLKCLAFV
eukprot:607807-Pelagomonas_calceolata.AAC.2